MTAETPDVTAELTPARASRPARLRRFALFAANGLITAAAFTVGFWILRELWPHRVAADVVGAWACSVVANYLGGRMVFGATTSIRTHLPRYATVLLGNALVTWGIATAAEHAGLPDFAVAYLPVVITAIPTFLLMQNWVFAE